MNDFLDLVELLLYFEQLVGLRGVLPLVKELIYLWVLQLDVRGDALIHSGVGGERLSEVHD